MSRVAAATASSRRTFLRRMAGSLAAGFGIALGRFPAATLAIAGLALLANLEVANSPLLRQFDAGHLATALLVATHFSVAATLASEARQSARSLRLLVGSIAAAVSGALVWLVREPYLFAPPLLAASILAVFLAPSVGRSDSLRCWTFGLWTLLGCLLGFASVMLFVIGGSAIVEMVRYLFGIGPRPEIYKHVYASAIVFVGPVFALGRIPRDFSETTDERQPDRMLIGLKALADWIAAPLTLVAALLLHAYAIKLALTANLPANELGWIVSTYIVILLSQRILVEPFRTSGGVATAWFWRLWAWLLVLPLVLLGYSIWLRVGSEGWTVERYFLALICLGAALIAVAQLVPKLRGDVRIIVAVFAMLLTVASFGPLSVPQLVGRSQIALIRQEFASDGGLIRTASLSSAKQNQLRSRIEALGDVGALSELAPMLPQSETARQPGQWTSSAEVLEALALLRRSQALQRKNFLADRTAAFDVSGFDTVYGVITERGEGGPVSAAIEGARLRIKVGSISDAVSLDDLAERLEAMASNGKNREALTIDRTTMAGRTVRLRILSASIEGGAIRNLAFDMALRRADWPL